MNVLIVEGHASLSKIIETSLLVSRIDTIDTPNIGAILGHIQVNDTHVVFFDYDRDQERALALLYGLKHLDAYVEVVFIGAPLGDLTVMELINQGLTEYLAKPVRPPTILDILKKVRDRKMLRQETFQLERRLAKKYFFQGIVGKNPYMLEIFSLIEKIAQYFSTILITGETGTGKEMIANAIHAMSRTGNKILVICDCVSIPDTLIESELFGYARGAFTGADKDKKGLFAQAEDGIIFLDEIGDIPHTFQAKLLRVIEKGEYRPLGTTENLMANVRIIASTNRDLRESVRNGSFREDLFHRLNKVEIHLPPLRDKPEDIPLLIRYFLDNFNDKFKKEIRGVSRRVQKLFLKYDWPGNIRELENVLERAAMLCMKEFIDIDDLPEELQEKFASKSHLPFLGRDQLSSLEDLEKDYILYLLDLTKHNMLKTAKILSISRTTLYNKLEKYGIKRKANA
ncbi:MAG: sigma-54 dependent transcriptional regulator [Candidatus Aminicenantaceae bacterium]